MTAWTLQELVDNQLNVTLPAGVIEVGQGSTTLRTGQTITGHPLGTTIKVADGSYAGELNMFYVDGVTGVTIQGVRFDGNQAAAANTSNTYGVRIINGGAVTITDCEFFDIEADGISMLTTTSSLTLSNSSFQGMGRFGVLVSGGVKASVVDCHFSDCGSVPLTVNAYATNVTVTGCDFVGDLANSERRLVSIFGTVGFNTTTVLVDDCTLTGGFMRLTEVDGAVISNCTISYLSTAGDNGALELQGTLLDTQVTNCKIRGGGTTACVRVAANSATRLCTGLTLTGCTLVVPSTCGDGIYVAGGYGVTVDSCNIRRIGATAAGNGIRAQSTVTSGADMTGFVFKDNTIINFATGISLIVDRQNIVAALLCDNAISGHTTFINETEGGGFTVTLDTATSC